VNSNLQLKDRFVEWARGLQSEIVSMLECFEPNERFREVEWQRPGKTIDSNGGGGTSRVISNGKVFEKGGVNVSVVHGELPKTLMERLGSSSADFFAAGISLVIHPHSPQVPTVHANFRYFEQPHRSWFGGGVDLTPYTYSESDFIDFHRYLKVACDSFEVDAYSRFKAECDSYFYLPHRKESRGIGGIFYDYQSKNLEDLFLFAQNSGKAFLKAYQPMVQRNLAKTFTERQKKFQCLRRGRYVEFNLVYDRGTLFGLQTEGNIESILMSLPPVVHFDFAPSLEETEEERKLMECFRNPRSWV